MWTENIEYLPHDLISLEFKSNSNEIKFFKISYGVENVIISNKVGGVKYSINLSNLANPQKILFVNSDKKIFNTDLFECDVLVLERQNDSINLTNLPNCIQMIKLYDGFADSLDWLPNSITKIVFDGDINSYIGNIPSSVKNVYFNQPNVDLTKLSELPESVKHFYLKRIPDKKSHDTILFDRMITKIRLFY